MKNPLFKRLPYILKDEIAKYLIIFLFMAGSIGLISGFLVADGSMIKAYNDSFDKYGLKVKYINLVKKNLFKVVLPGIDDIKNSL